MEICQAVQLGSAYYIHIIHKQKVLIYVLHKNYIVYNSICMKHPE